MTAPERLFAAILADPEDTGLRLRYADAIEPTDPDHARLIRLAVAGSRDRPALRLGAVVLPRITAPVAALVDDLEVARGFVDSVTMRGADFLARGDRVWRLAPVRHLRLTEVGGLLPEVVASPLLDRLMALDLGDNPVGDDGVRILVDSPHLRRLRWLGLSNCDIGADGAEALAATRNLPALRYVDLARNRVPITPYGVGDGIDGRPVWVERPPLADDLDARYGPLPWLSSDWARERAVPYHAV